METQLNFYLSLVQVHTKISRLFQGRREVEARENFRHTHTTSDTCDEANIDGHLGLSHGSYVFL